MNELLRRPLISLGLVVLWLVLAGFSIGHLILGVLIAWLATLAMRPLELPLSPIRRWRPFIRLIGVVFVDIIKSNIGVAQVILAGPDSASQRSGFLDLDLELRDPNALALLAIIVTSTPGTAWIDYDPVQNRLLLHVLDLTSPEEWRGIIKGRYERLLRETFE
ncbi:Na+/H+ antiporter subunit E [Paracoccus sp. S-4012]|uniref:Na+/H+ antiporter subunit E n=1 Tax=Paracoccus sp. S-4012 TaxID=2665648 RepID=UPI0012AF2C5E|nr:Na+/H+ antiporter subunit E [Paracoccus sp. S-4012]MRX50354.1 Na+/H+ antiporter subunit E [Paracoccus sp. S-4012]